MFGQFHRKPDTANIRSMSILIFLIALALITNLLRRGASTFMLLIKNRPVMEALDLAMETLFPYTDFHKASFDLFLRLVDGRLTFEEEQMLNALGVKF